MASPEAEMPEDGSMSGSGSYTGSSSYTEEAETGSESATGSSYASNEEEEDEMVPDEDTMKYRTFPVACLTTNEQISAVLIGQKFIFLATDRGVVNVLDLQGNLLFKSAHHVNLIKDLSTDDDENYIGSCCVGSIVTIKRLYSNTKDDFFTKSFEFPLTSLALHPKFDTKDGKPFLCGGLDGVVNLVTKTWPFGNRSCHVLGSKEGQIYMIRWHGEFAVWANEACVVFCHPDTKTVFHRIPRPQPAPRGDMFHCTFAWESDNVLLIAWGNWVRCCEIKQKQIALKDVKSLLASYEVEVDGGFETDRGALSDAYRICGAAPFSAHELLLLAVRVTAEVHVSRLQVRIVDRHTGELKSLHEYKGKTAFVSGSYSLAYNTETCGEDSEFGAFYIVSPDLIILAERCDDDDKVEFLLQRKQYRDAFAVGKSRPLQRYDVEKLGVILLNALIKEECFDEAASRFREILGTSDDAEPKWKRWIDLFIHKQKEEHLVRHLPFMENGLLNGPRLHPKIYEKVLASCLERDQLQQFKEYVVKFWHLYNPVTVANFLEYRYKRMRAEKAKGMLSEGQLVLAGETLGLLHELQGKHGEALSVFLDVRGGEELFEFIERHSLYAEAAGVLDVLFQKNEKRTIRLLLNHRTPDFDERAIDPLGPEAVVKKLSNVNRDKLWVYLEALRVHDGGKYQKVAKEFSEMFTLLYATYDRKHLLSFLKSILPSLNLRVTFDICKEKGLIEERVYIMARMGNRDEGLDVIVREMKNVGKAIDYIRDFESDEDQKELYERLFNLVFLAEENTPAFQHKVEQEETVSDIMQRYGVRREDIRPTQMSKVRVNDEQIEVEQGVSLRSIADEHDVPVEQIELLPPCSIEVTPHMLSQLLTAISDPQVGETSVIDATSLVKRIPEKHDIPELGRSLSAILASKGGYSTLMETLLRVLNGDVSDMYKGLRRSSYRAVRVTPAQDRTCALCHSVIDNGSFVVFSCRHSMHSTCLYKEIAQDDSLKGMWINHADDPDDLFRSPQTYLREKLKRPTICCRVCPQSEEASGL